MDGGESTSRFDAITSTAVAIVLAIVSATLVTSLSRYVVSSLGTDFRANLTRLLTDGRGVTVFVSLAYLVIVVVTSRGLIAAPNYRILDRSLRDCQARARVLRSKSPTETACVAYDVITAEIGRLGKNGEIASWTRGIRVVWAIPLTKLAAGWRAFHATERRLVDLVPNPALGAYAENIVSELRRNDEQAADARRQEIAGCPTVDGKRLVIEYAHFLVHCRAEEKQEEEFEKQRIALWLTAVGLFGVVVVGFALGHRGILVAGALGGFLAPAVGALLGRDSKSLGVIVLSPVSGALAAIGGLLLVQLVGGAGSSLLAQSVASPWGAPGEAPSPSALALGLLLGFSGRLFSQIAISATGQIASPREPRPDAAKNRAEGPS